MGKRKTEFIMHTYGEYSHWDRESKELPKILNITETIEAEVGTEFGYVLKILRGKGKKLTFKIEHPPFNDMHGNIRPPFTGEFYIGSNDYEFFLGDCIWEPLEDKLGDWRMITYFEGKIVADKTLHLIAKK